MNPLGPESFSIVLKLLVATGLGALIGVERELTRRYAGLRTFALVSLGACLFTILANDMAIRLFGRESADPTRIIGQIVMGVGFLGAGLIVFQHERVVNLTTAAAGWVTAAIGTTVGFGSYDVAISATFIALFVLIILRIVEEKMGWRETEQSDSKKS